MVPLVMVEYAEGKFVGMWPQLGGRGEAWEETWAVEIGVGLLPSLNATCFRWGLAGNIFDLGHEMCEPNTFLLPLFYIEM